MERREKKPGRAVLIGFLVAPLFGGVGLAQHAYELDLACPAPEGDTSEGSATTVRAVCPFRIIDGQDALGSPSLAVNPLDPQQIAIASLHGGQATPGPTPRSREASESPAGVFTVLTSGDGGYRWNDQPSGPPPIVLRDAEFGEHLALAMDGQGRLYGAGLYSERASEADPYGGRLAVWEWDVASEQIEWMHSPDAAKHLAPSVLVSDVALTNVPPPGSSLVREPPWKGGPEAGGGTSWQESVVLTWLEAPAVEGETLAGKRSVVRAAWTDAEQRLGWRHLPTDQSFGPCRSVSNAVAWEGSVYLVCLVEDAEAYGHRPGAAAGDIDLWRIDPGRARAELVGATPLTTGRPTLAASAEGRFILAAIDQVGSEVTLAVAASWSGRDWARVADIGTSIRSGATDLLDVRVQAIVYRADSHTIHLVYQEFYAPTQVDATQPGVPHTARFAKFLVALNECEGVLATPRNLQIGLVHSYAPVLELAHAAASVRRTDFALFDDLVDGLVLVPGAGESQREFLAVGDYGVVQFAEVVERNAPPCNPAGPERPVALGGPASPVGAQPAAQSALTAAQWGAGIVGGVLALAMVLRLVGVRAARRDESLSGSKK